MTSIKPSCPNCAKSAEGWFNSQNKGTAPTRPSTHVTMSNGLRPNRSLNKPAAITTGSPIAMLNELISSARDGGMPSAGLRQLPGETKLTQERTEHKDDTPA